MVVTVANSAGVDEQTKHERKEDRSEVSFVINGKPYSVKPTIGGQGPESRLVDYIRDEAGLKGTKWTCREGGCGACVVTVRTQDPQNGKEVVRAVNSCLAPVLSCDGWDISTVEDLGNRNDGFHAIQRRLANFSGTQCGFCSPGMVMNMYSLTKSKKELRSQDIEDNFDGNICRCTGYRPILDAFKSFAVDADPALQKRSQDIEDLCYTCPSKNGRSNGVNGGQNGNGTCSKTSNEGRCGKSATFQANNLNLYLPNGIQWTKVTDLKQMLEVVNNHGKNNIKYRIVAGNTGTGVFKYDGPYDAYVEINSVPELGVTSMEKTHATLGAAVTLTSTIEFLENLSHKPGFEYASGMSKHIKRVANTPVRNFGTIAGNLMMKHAHNDFPSDIFLLFETVGAKVYIASSPIDISAYSPVEFLKVDMRGKVVVYLTLPKREGGYVFRSFKITKRHQNAHAYVNAAFLFKIDPEQRFKVLERPSITFGGINPTFLHSAKTEEFLTGAELGDMNTLKKALQILEEEVQPDHQLPDASPEYRRSLAQNLLYKTALRIVGSNADKSLRSGADDLPRKEQSGKQFYDTDEEFKTSPLYKPVPKLEATLQCSGEAEYINDIPKQAGELFASFVITTVANAVLKRLDASEALKVPGVVAFITAKDIPGRNSFWDGFISPGKEEIFVEIGMQVRSSGQAVGMIVAESSEIAKLAVELVKIEYDKVEMPVLKIKQALDIATKQNKLEDVFYPTPFATESEPSKTSKHVIQGEFQVGGQAHFPLENHVTLAVPKEDGLTVYSATQNMNGVQGTIANALNIPNNSIDIQVRRLGGGYGAKISRAHYVAVAAALAAHITRKPVRMVLDLESCMEMMGKRLPYYFNYRVGFDDDGKIDSLHADVICDPGMHELDATSRYAVKFMQNCYAIKGWSIKPGRVITNTHANTFCRAPASTQGIAAIEHIMEHIADELNKDPLEIRRVNYLQQGDDVILDDQKEVQKFTGVNLAPLLVEEMKTIADYEIRKQLVEEFNRTNRWRKRGLAMVPMKYPQSLYGKVTTAFIAVHNQDGTVSVSHGGIEMGQGINTKVAQVVAHELNIPLSKIQVKPSNNLVSANSSNTGGAITSELVCYATLRACQKLQERMEPMRKENENVSWEELVKKCHQAGIDLRSTHMQSPREDHLKSYDVYGCNLTEVEVDILTGEFKILRLDLIEDAGKSLSPEVDMGQIEGSLVMGLGLWSEEKLVFHPVTGRLLTRNTWEYKVPFPKCIPEDMRITIMRKGTNPNGVLRSKATGEPPLCMAVAVLFAIKNAIKSARKDVGNTDWFPLDGPVTPEDIVQNSLVDPQSQFVY